MGPLGTVFVLLDAGFILACFALGFRSGILATLRRIGRTRRLLSLARGLAAGLFVLACWGLWMRLGYMADLGRAGSLRYPLLAAAAGVAEGTRRLVPYALSVRSAPVGSGLALLLPSLAVLTVAPLVLSREPLPLPAASATVAPVPDRKMPNIVWLIMDKFRADALSCYGNPRRPASGARQSQMQFSRGKHLDTQPNMRNIIYSTVRCREVNGSMTFRASSFFSHVDPTGME